MSGKEPSRSVIVKQTQHEITEEVCHLFRKIICDSVGRRKACKLSLAGGTTPHALYQALARGCATDDTPWSDVEVFFGDERDVPQDHVESNYGMAQRTLLDHVPIQPAHMHPMPADADDLPAAAAEYEEVIRRVVPAGEDDLPRFDLVLLGMGADGHAASLFPHTDALSEDRKLVVAQFVPVLGRHRMTFTYPLINAARHVIFLVTEDDKGEAVRQLLGGGADPQNLPAAGVRPSDGALTFVFDGAAARRAGLRPE